MDKEKAKKIEKVLKEIAEYLIRSDERMRIIEKELKEIQYQSWKNIIQLQRLL